MGPLRRARVVVGGAGVVAALLFFSACGLDLVGVGDGSSSGNAGDGGAAGDGARPDGDANVNLGEGGVPDAETDAPAPVGGKLDIKSKKKAASEEVDLSDEGKIGWRHWGTTSGNALSTTTKASAPTEIPTFVLTGTADLATFGDGRFEFDWDDGAPTATANNLPNGVYAKGVGATFTITRVAGPGKRELKIYAGVHSARGELTATMGPPSNQRVAVATFENDTMDGTNNGYVELTVKYTAVAPTDSITVAWKMIAAKIEDAGNANITLSAATLADDDD